MANAISLGSNPALDRRPVDDIMAHSVRNEELVGEALARFGGQVVIATTFGIRRDSSGQPVQDSRPETIKQSLEDSLKRLRVDAIDLY